MQILDSDQILTGRLERNLTWTDWGFAHLVDERGKVICSIEQLLSQLTGQRIQVSRYRDERGEVLATVIVATPGGTAP